MSTLKTKGFVIKVVLLIPFYCVGQNSLIGDGFGGRLWYQPSNYSVGSYSAYSICSENGCSGDNQLYGWGSNGYGQLGYDIAYEGFSTPMPVPGMSDIKYYSTGYMMSAIKNDNSGWVWGSILPYTPTQVIENVRFTDAGISNAVFVKHDGTVWSVGQNQAGEFGTGNQIELFETPVQMPGIQNAVRVACGVGVTYILEANGKVKSIGANNMGLLGLGDVAIIESLIPVEVPILKDIVDIKSNSVGVVALKSDGDVYSWGNQGDNSNGYNIPTLITQLENIVAISACADGVHYLALDANGNCFGWGGYQPAFGADMSEYITTPVLVATDVIDIMAGEFFSYIVKSDGSLWASGSSLSSTSSIWLNLPGDLSSTEFLKLDPSLVNGTCRVQNTIAKTSFNCESLGTIEASVIGGNGPFLYDIGFGQQESPVFNQLLPGEYHLSITDIDGCVSHRIILIYGVEGLFGNDFEAQLYIPNIFTPNNDLQNQSFGPKGITSSIGYEFRIFNRWGNEIFHTKEITEGWNGNIDGEPAPEGTYFFILRSQKFCSNEVLELSGSLSLLR